MTVLAAAFDLAISFPATDGTLTRVVDGATLRVGEGEVVGLVGESGAGKTLTALALARLLPPGARIDRGRVELAGEDVVSAPEARLEQLRGGVIGYVLQEPSQALNPVRAVWFQVTEAARLRHGTRGRAARELAVELLREVGLDDAQEIARAFPHQLSGGQRQRVLLASALSGRPRLIVADEPTSALDTVSQARLVEELRGLVSRRGLALLFVSHDLPLVGRIVQRVVVAYAGETVEDAPWADLVARPLHPYSRALLAVGRVEPGLGGSRFATVAGNPPRPADWGSGCRFAPRCPHVFDRCRLARPALVEAGPGRAVRCFLHSPEAVDG